MEQLTFGQEPAGTQTVAHPPDAPGYDLERGLIQADSKRLTPPRRSAIASILLSWVEAFAIGEAEHSEIDAAGMTVALRRAALL